MNSSLILYLERPSFIHRRHPLTKLVLMFCSILIAFLGPGFWIAWGVLFFLLGLARLGQVFVPLTRKSGAILLPLLFFMFVIHGLFSPVGQTPVWQLGLVTVKKEGLLFATLMSGRLLATVAASLLFVFCTAPADLMIALKQKGIPPAVVYVLGSTLQIIPMMKKRSSSIMAAQQTRGVETEGSMRKRIKAFFPMLKPLILSSLIDVEERAIALEARGFWAQGAATAWREIPDSPLEQWGRRLLLGATVVILLSNYWLG